MRARAEIAARAHLPDRHCMPTEEAEIASVMQLPKKLRLLRDYGPQPRQKAKVVGREESRQRPKSALESSRKSPRSFCFSLRPTITLRLSLGRRKRRKRRRGLSCRATGQHWGSMLGLLATDTIPVATGSREHHKTPGECVLSERKSG
jgi:hypothetical protein